MTDSAEADLGDNQFCLAPAYHATELLAPRPEAHMSSFDLDIIIIHSNFAIFSGPGWVCINPLPIHLIIPHKNIKNTVSPEDWVTPSKQPEAGLPRFHGGIKGVTAQLRNAGGESPPQMKALNYHAINMQTSAKLGLNQISH